MPNFDLASMGSASRASVGATGGAATQAIWFESFGLRAAKTHVDNNGVNGTVGLRSENVTEGLIDVSGPIILKPRPEELAFLLPLICGTPVATNVYALAEGMTEHVWAVNRVAESTQFNGCVVSRATFTAQPGQPLGLSLDIIGKTADEALSYPSLDGTLSALQPWMAHYFVLTINSIQYECNNWQLVIDNGIKPDVYRMSQTRLVTPRGTRTITLSMEIPHTASEAALYNLAVGGLGATLVGTNPTGAGHVLTFAFAKLQAPTDGPTVPNRNQEITRRVQWTARMLGSTKELITTLT